MRPGELERRLVALATVAQELRRRLHELGADVEGVRSAMDDIVAALSGGTSGATAGASGASGAGASGSSGTPRAAGAHEESRSPASHDSRAESAKAKGDTDKTDTGIAHVEAFFK